MRERKRDEQPPVLDLPRVRDPGLHVLLLLLGVPLLLHDKSHCLATADGGDPWGQGGREMTVRCYSDGPNLESVAVR